MDAELRSYHAVRQARPAQSARFGDLDVAESSHALDQLTDSLR
ncbi:hypothetical protein ABZ953_07115 [Streptomyces sp. NPDC046465]